ncbi:MULTISPECIES: 6,7-dimethyl-8-ribityllumazine synthase [Gracilimonas]|uniref:6,7-dimethyl-8-ribityllumazine synthase n=1 Tax=Gracilimonas sediminicola TaxID=2952158 RepID=A0A9X2REJ7_9BACT|nr:6,7-dimethyl-8-ribityllumazine synthase [Gracilimonas sediminicola]MCP9292015.1 6,7-dimethyl-8-ribityllumazine synthase [Gracilimonas sediminicola]
MAAELIEGDTNPGKVKIGIVVSKWNSMITDKMLDGALKALKGNGIEEADITVVKCPGSYEIPLTVQKVLENRDVAGVIALGVVIRGGTPHFDYVCDAVNRGITDLILKHNKPVAFGVLTTDDVKQAMERAGEKGNKGGEAALALLEMISMEQKLTS